MPPERLAASCVIPAAGLSERLGRSKPLATLAGRPLIYWAVRHAASACSQVIVVVGHDGELVRQATPAFPHVTVVENDEYRRGMLTSIRRGVEEVDREYFFVAPADMPFLTPALFGDIFRRAVPEEPTGLRVPSGERRPGPGGAPPGGHEGVGHSDSQTTPDPRRPDRDKVRTASPELSIPRPAAWFPVYRETRGHPVLVRTALRDRLRSSGAATMREFLHDFDTAELVVRTQAVTIDLDTEEALSRYQDFAAKLLG